MPKKGSLIAFEASVSTGLAVSGAAGVSGAVLQSVAGAAQLLFEADGEAACRIDAATEADIDALRQKLAVLGGSVKLVLKCLPEEV